MIRDGRIADILPSSSPEPPAERIIDVCGQYVFPAFVDFHTHLFASGSGFGMDADRLLSTGVTTAVDMGTAGWENYDRFHAQDVAGKNIRIRSYLNVSPIGQPGKGICEPLDDDTIDPARIRETIERYPDEILGLKVRLSRNIVGDLGSRPLARAIEIGENLGLPVCVHTTDPPVSAVEIAKMLRPGDIYCHMYQGRGHTILDESGRVWPELFEAQRRGVVFEVGHGSMNFDARIAGESVKQGFWPDIISSDSTVNTFHKSETMWDLPHVLSKFLTMGMPLHRAIQAVISVPADKLGLGGLIGRLEKGYAAELTVCRITKREVSGAICASLQEETSLTPQMTIRGTEVIYPE